MGFAGSLWGNWGLHFFPPKEMSRTPKAEGFWRSREGTFVLVMGLFFVCLLLWETRKDNPTRLFIAQLLSANFWGGLCVPGSTLLCGRFKKGDVFAGSVQDIKMRPPQAVLGAVPTGPLPGSLWWPWEEGLLHLCFLRSDHPWLWKLVCLEGNSRYEAVSFPPHSAFLRVGETEREVKVKPKESETSQGLVSVSQLMCGHQKNLVQAPIWASCLTYLGFGFPTCKMRIVMLSH